jgi:hypothetical protein
MRRETTRRWLPGLGVLVLWIAGCGSSTPYYLVQSRLVESQRIDATPDVTVTPTFRAISGSVEKIALRPPDVCADRGISGSGGQAQLQLGVMRTRCGVEMAAFERALARAGYEVVSWSAVQHMASAEDKSILESAADLEIDVLLQVNALERIDITPGRDARWERRFYEATRSGEPRDPVAVDAARRLSFDRLISQKEAHIGGGTRVGAMINVSAVWVESGSTVWFYEWTRIDEIAVDPEVEVLVDCAESRCIEVQQAAPVASSGSYEGSIVGISTSGDPADRSQAIFSELVRELVTDLAERFAGRRS